MLHIGAALRGVCRCLMGPISNPSLLTTSCTASLSRMCSRTRPTNESLMRQDHCLERPCFCQPLQRGRNSHAMTGFARKKTARRENLGPKDFCRLSGLGCVFARLAFINDVSLVLAVLGMLASSGNGLGCPSRWIDCLRPRRTPHVNGLEIVKVPRRMNLQFTNNACTH